MTENSAYKCGDLEGWQEWSTRRRQEEAAEV